MLKGRIAVSTSSEIKRLKELGYSKSKIAKALQIDRRTVSRHWDGPSKVDRQPSWYSEVNWEDLYTEFLNGVKVKILYEELIERATELPSYQAFCRHFSKYKAKRGLKDQVTVRVERTPGESVEVDYAGSGIDLINPASREIVKTELFVGTMSFSGYTYAEFCYSQKLPDFINCHQNMFQEFNKVPLFVIPDNLKAGVDKAHRYDPSINKSYHDMCIHYGVGVRPARVGRPQDKPNVEKAVGIIQQEFYSLVRHKTFTSLYELNTELRQYIKKLNSRLKVHQKLSRTELFTKELEVMKKLPLNKYNLFNWKKSIVHNDCHIQFHSNYYSVPYRYVGQEVDIKYNEKILTVIKDTEVLAIHTIKKGHGHFSTIKSHYPVTKMIELDLTVEKAKVKAKGIGQDTLSLVEELIQRGVHPYDNLRKITGILNLSKKYEANVLNYACSVAMKFKRLNYQYINQCAKNYSNQTSEDAHKAPVRDKKLICLQGGEHESNGEFAK